MIEPLSHKQINLIFPVGGPVILLYGGEIAEGTINGVVSDWSKRTCSVALPPGGELQLPARGGTLEIVTARLDGVFRLPGTVKAIDLETVAPETPAGRTLHVEVDVDRARRIQQREFFRLTGCWQADITPLEDDETVSADESGQARVWNLSASGLLLEDQDRILRPGDHFRIEIDLRDGDSPLRVQAEVVRRDERSSGNAVQWGCHFVDLAIEDENRIVRFLHDKIRARLAVKSKSLDGEGRHTA